MLSVRRAFDYLVPPFVCAYIAWGWYLVVFEVGVGWLLRTRHHWIAVPYLLVVPALLLWTSGIYYSLITLPSNHSVPPLHPPRALVSRSMAFECVDDRGSLAVCTKPGGKCSGKWKPPRTHHCSTCGVCRMGFDHHCPWIGNCVTIQNRPHFLLFLLLTTFTIPLAASPVLGIVFRHARDAIHVARTDPVIAREWWDSPWSWVEWGGPVGRYARGLVLGYQRLRERAPTGSRGELGCMVTEPDAVLFFTVVVGFMFSAFTAVLFYTSLRNAAKGLTTVDEPQRLRHRSFGKEPLIWIPTGEDGEGKAVPALTSEWPYDLGWKANIRLLWDRPKVKSPARQYVPLQLNPKMLDRIEDTLQPDDRRSPAFTSDSDATIRP